MPEHDQGLPKQRTYKAHADRLRALRIERGWTVGTLAHEAVCSPKTIDSLEAGNEAYLVTFQKVGKALNVSPRILIDGGPEDAAIAMTGPKQEWTCFEFRLQGRLDAFDETVELIRTIQHICKLAGVEIVPTRISPGSILIQCEATHPARNELLMLFSWGHFQDVIDQFSCEIDESLIDAMAHFLAHYGRSYMSKAKFRVQLANLEVGQETTFLLYKMGDRPLRELRVVRSSDEQLSFATQDLLAARRSPDKSNPFPNAEDGI